MANEDDISASNGDADVPQENDIESNFAEPFVHEESRSSNSVVARLRERASQTKELKRVMQQWCREPNPVIEDLERLAPYLFGVKCSENESCTICDAVTRLKACCDHFLECKTEHDASEKAYAAAVELHEQLIKQRSSKKGRALKAVNWRLSLQAQNVTGKAALLLKDARSISSMNGRIAVNSTMVLNATVHVADNHSHIQFLLGALGAAGNRIHQ